MTTCAIQPAEMSDLTDRRAEQIYQEQLRAGYERVDQLFAVLLVLEWSVAVSFAILVTPYTWAGETRWVHLHVWSAIILGGAIVSLPVGLTMLAAGRGDHPSHGGDRSGAHERAVDPSFGRPDRDVTSTFSFRSRSWRFTATGRF